jgi:predicted DNA-binding transcriptional regulator YafY
MRSKQRSAKGRNDQLLRILALIRELSEGGDTVEAFAARFGTSVKTIRRDLIAIESAQLPLASHLVDGKKKHWRLPARDKLEQLSALLDASHYLALRVAMAPGAPMQNTSKVFAELEDFGQKIEQALGPKGRETLASIEACFQPYEKGVYKEAPPDVLWPLVNAIRERRMCRVTYGAPGGDPPEKTYDVLPLKLFAYQGALYLMCQLPWASSPTTLHLHRLRGLRVLRKKGKPPRDFDPRKLETAAFGVFASGNPTTYRLRFDPGVAPYIRERSWHPTQRLDERADGGVDLRFRCDASPEVASWVQSWGDGVEVLAPASLRRELGALGEWLSSTYRERGADRGRSARVGTRQASDRANR